MGIGGNMSELQGKPGSRALGKAGAILLLLHVLLWVVLAFTAYHQTGSHTFARCWTVMLIFPPFWLGYLGLLAYSGLTLLSSISRRHVRHSAHFQFAWHGLILVLGMAAWNIAAVSRTGWQGGCL